MNGIVPTGHNVAANGIRQHVLRYHGPGAPLVLVPGITSPAVTWGFVAERLARVFETYVLDVRGRGLSSTGDDLDYGLDAMAEDVVALLAALDLKDAVVAGHSMGARIAMRAANRDARNISRLLLIDPPVSGPGRRAYPAKLDWYVDSIQLAERGMDGEAMKAFCPTWTPEQRALRAEWLHSCSQTAVVTAFEGFHTDEIFPDFGALRVPASLMIAGRGGVIQPEDEAEIRALNPSIRVAWVANAGHMIPWDDLDGFLSATETLLDVTLV